jgi:hypothetical protein
MKAAVVICRRWVINRCHKEAQSAKAMLKFLTNRLQARPTNACFCTLAIHGAYRERARVLVGDAPVLPWVVLTDEPGEFEGLPVRAIEHVPTGPMAIDFVTKLPPTGNGRGRPAYHDKRFALQAALEQFDTAIFVDADTRIRSLPRLPVFRPGIAVVKEVNASIAEHLSRWGSHRRTAFEKLALELIGDAQVIKSARWCSEALFAITKDGNEGRFFEAWGRAAEFLHSQGVFTGEGGVIGLSAMYSRWTVDYGTMGKLARAMRHEGGGPK